MGTIIIITSLVLAQESPLDSADSIKSTVIKYCEIIVIIIFLLELLL